MGGVVDTLTGKSGERAATAARDAASVQAGAQREALDYLKEREALPQEFREGALTQLAGLYGLPGGEGSQAQMIEQAKQSPLYQAMMGTREAGEDAILRHASATGGLRSGNVQANLAEFNQNLENQALLTAYGEQKQGLAGLAGLSSMAPQIAQQMAGIGQTQAQGMTAAAQAQQSSDAALTGTAASLAGMAMLAFCDSRLKENVKPAGERLGVNWYTWDWNKDAEELGLTGKGEGVMAHELAETHPHAVGIGKTGYLLVNYGALL